MDFEKEYKYIKKDIAFLIKKYENQSKRLSELSPNDVGLGALLVLGDVINKLNNLIKPDK